ncbi:MAG: DUF983 domain-containing protein [Alphaproteobacteria bacterium]
MEEEYYPPVSPLAAGIGCRCPRCGQGKLYNGFLQIAKSCARCQLDLGEQDAGDGAVAFVTLFLGFIVVGLAMWVEFTFEPPFWLHALLWLPVILGGTVAMLRPLKAFLIAQQYKHRRRQNDAI